MKIDKNFNRITFGDVCDVLNGKSQKDVANENGKYPIYGSGGIMGYANDYLCKAGTTIIGRKGTINSPIYVNQPFWNIDTAFGLYPKDERLTHKYLYYYCLHFDFTKIQSGSAIPSLTKKDIQKNEIYLPNTDIQHYIATELDTLQSLITQYREQLNDYDKLAQSIFHEMFGDVEYTSPLINYIDGFIGGKSLAGKYECKNKVLKTSAVSSLYFKAHEVKNLPIDFEPSDEYRVNRGDVLISRMNTPELVGACAYVWNVYNNTYLPDRLWRIKIKENINPIFLWFNLISKDVRAQIKGFASGTSGSMKNITKSSLMKVKIMSIPLPLQQQFATRIESIEAQKTLIKQQLSDVQTLFDSRMQYYFN